ncbi:MFS transporter [Francisellaceae bacterium]|nr:MFS transporter [Francisellaceae bacterium]
MKNNKTLIILISVLLSVPLGQLFIDIYVPAFTNIQGYFGTKPAMVQLSLTVYFITFGIFQILYGSLSDIIGRKKPLLIGLAFGLIGSVLIRFSSNIDMFLIGRVIQGIGMGGVSGIGGAILVDYFSKDPADLARKNTYVSIAYNITPVVAPYIGGLLLYLLDWHAIFEFLFIYNLLVLLWISFLYFETKQEVTIFSFKKYFQQFKTYKAFLANSSFWYISVTLGTIWGMTLTFMSLGPFVYHDLFAFTGYQFGILALVMGLASLLGSILSRILLILISSEKLLFILAVLNVILGVVLIPVALLSVGYFIYFTAILFAMFIVYGATYPNAYTILMLLFKENAGSSISLSVTISVSFCMFVTAICAVLPESILSLSAMELFLSLLSGFLIYKIVRRVK